MDNFKKKTLVFIYSLLAILLYTVIQEAMYSTFSLFKGLLNEDADLLALIAAALICIPFYYKWYRYRIRFKKHIILKEVFTYKNVLAICFIGISINLFFSSFIELFQITSYFKGYENSISIITNGNIMLSSILVVVLAPICEELIHRGITYENFKANFNQPVAHILQAILFGLVHGDLLQILYSFVLGLLLGYIYEKYKSIYVPILTHALFNGTSILNSFLFSDEMQNNNLIMLTVCLLSGILFLFALKYVKNSPSVKYIPEPGAKMINLKELQQEYKL